ncbi:MAG: PD-(D/E)XK nuclease family protein, partial [Paludibacteraceae bacterium]|nr:PD-(D/E)XK nuclease family protein [Paludibacteraceae bacterium]
METPFLQKTARAFYNKYGAEISKYCFVFPSRRAGLFFQKYLSAEIKQPIFSPKIETIESFYEQLGDKRVEDRLGLLFRLYKCYKQVVNKDETFDNFVWLGEVLLADFNDIDNHLVDAKKLFANANAMTEMTSDALTDEQRKAVSDFLRLTPKENNDEKLFQRNYFNLWSKLYDLYKAFGEDLQKDGLTYRGKQHSDIVEYLPKIPYEKVVFIGFSAMSKRDHKLFGELKRLGIADFYWDYESPLICDKANRASRFYVENVNQYPSEIHIAPNTTKPKVHCVAVPSNVGQVKYAYEILKKQQQVGLETAVVLSDEKLLVPMLYSIPEKDASERDIPINVTMSYPLKNSPVLKLLNDCIAMQRDYKKGEGFWFKQVLTILQHPQIQANFKGIAQEHIA